MEGCLLITFRLFCFSNVLFSCGMKEGGCFLLKSYQQFLSGLLITMLRIPDGLLGRVFFFCSIFEGKIA